MLIGGRIFIFLGLTGIALAVLVKLVLREPVRGAMEFDDQTEIKKAALHGVTQDSYKNSCLVGNVLWDSFWLFCFLFKISISHESTWSR